MSNNANICNKGYTFIFNHNFYATKEEPLLRAIEWTRMEGIGSGLGMWGQRDRDVKGGRCRWVAMGGWLPPP